MNDSTEYQLTPAELAIIQEYDAAIKGLVAQQQGALKMIAKQQGLIGNWDVQGDKLVKRPEPQPMELLPAPAK